MRARAEMTDNDRTQRVARRWGDQAADVQACLRGRSTFALDEMRAEGR